ncbi:MAG: endonuclease/exonuclease/phosphatase family protein [Alphaproteobacteria bacterium]
MSILRLMSYNIHSGIDRRGHRDLRRICDLMDNLDIDIGVFQEVETRPSYGGSKADIDILAGKNRPYHLPGPSLKESKGWYGNLIVSKYPIKRALVHNLETFRALQPRNAVDALIDTPHKMVRIIGTHLSLSSLVRWHEINNLIALASKVDDETPGPLFLLGDINEWRWPSKLLKHLNTIFTPLPAEKSFPSFCPVFRLDRAWYDHGNIKAHAQILKGPETKYLSDHLPLLIEVHKL